MAILALVEEGARFLSRPRRGEILDAILLNQDFVWDVAMHGDDLAREPFARAEGEVVARENSRALRMVDERRHDRVAVDIEPGTHQLDHEPAIVLIDH